MAESGLTPQFRQLLNHSFYIIMLLKILTVAGQHYFGLEPSQTRRLAKWSIDTPGSIKNEIKLLRTKIYSQNFDCH